MVPTQIPDRIGKATVDVVTTRGIITPPSGFINTYDGSINPYMGCTFGCHYCYAANFSRDPGAQENWGKWVKAKANAAKSLTDEPVGSLNGKVYYMSTVTDPYQPLERQTRTTRKLLHIMATRHPRVKLVIQTRSPLVTRDLDLLEQIDQAGGRVQVNMTVTTDNEEVRRLFEPGCPSNPARLKAITEVEEVVQGCITITPMLPLLNAAAFAETLKATGVERFIIQDFHVEAQNSPRYVAATHGNASARLVDYYGGTLQEAKKAYAAEYRHNLDILKARLPLLGQGKDGFKPPF